MILLDTKNKPIGLPIEVSRGILDSTPVHAREIYAKAIRCHAGAIILAHNHPSGDATPSREDIEITRRIIEAGRIIGIPVFDHIVVGHPRARRTPMSACANAALSTSRRNGV